MGSILQFVGPNGAVQLFGVKLVGINGANGRKLLFSIAFTILVWSLRFAILVRDCLALKAAEK